MRRIAWLGDGGSVGNYGTLDQAAIQGYWTRFARDGDPAGSPSWPAYGAGDPTLVLDAPVTATSGIRTADCDFWKPFYDAL